jgi:hypothetical protein
LGHDAWGNACDRSVIPARIASYISGGAFVEAFTTLPMFCRISGISVIADAEYFFAMLLLPVRHRNATTSDRK